MDQWSFEILPIQAQDCRLTASHSRRIYRVYLKSIKKIWKKSTCNWLDFETRESWPILTQNLLVHWCLCAGGCVFLERGSRSREFQLPRLAQLSPHAWAPPGDNGWENAVREDQGARAKSCRPSCSRAGFWEHVWVTAKGHSSRAGRAGTHESALSLKPSSSWLPDLYNFLNPTRLTLEI